MEILFKFYNSRGSVHIVKLDNGEVWKLNGECNRCGQCCDEYNMLIPEFSVDGRCNKLGYETVDGKKLATCSILWSRPAGCMVYPRDPYDDLPEKCSFTWEKVSG